LSLEAVTTQLPSESNHRQQLSLRKAEAKKSHPPASLFVCPWYLVLFANWLGIILNTGKLEIPITIRVKIFSQPGFSKL
jgi:hypothetical protein